MISFFTTYFVIFLISPLFCRVRLYSRVLSLRVRSVVVLPTFYPVVRNLPSGFSLQHLSLPFFSVNFNGPLRSLRFFYSVFLSSSFLVSFLFPSPILWLSLSVPFTFVDDFSYEVQLYFILFTFLSGLP